MPSTIPVAQIDVRHIAPRHRRALVLSTFRGLRPRETLEVVNDHEPRPLACEFETEMPDAFVWEALESGPAVWRVHITKRDVPPVARTCCGCCGGRD